MAATRAMHKPVIGWDAMLVHSFKAKEMFYDQTISAESGLGRSPITH
jgi:hypothetical protein